MSDAERVLASEMEFGISEPNEVFVEVSDCRGQDGVMYSSGIRSIPVYPSVVPFGCVKFPPRAYLVHVCRTPLVELSFPCDEGLLQSVARFTLADAPF